MTTMIISCEKELEISLPTTPPKLVVNSKLFQDSTFIVRVFRTSLINENHNNLWYIDTATVNVYSNNTFIETLKMESRGKYTGEHRIKPNTYYQLRVEANGFPTASSETETLDKVQIIKIDSLGTFVDAKTQVPIFKFAIHFKDNKDAKDYYMVDFSEYTSVGGETSPIYSKDPAIEVEDKGFTSDGITSYGSFYFSDEIFNGEEYAFSIYVPQYKVYEGFTVNLCHITPEYYKYIQTYKAQSESDGLSMFFQAVQVYSNIENGLGIFGAISSCSQKYEYEYPDDGGTFGGNE